MTQEKQNERSKLKLELQSINQALDSYVCPQSFPVAIRMINAIDEIPEKAQMPKRDLGTPLAVCQGVALARLNGWVIAMGKEDMLCPVGALTLGFVPARARFLDGSFAIPFWAKNQSVRAKMAQALPRLELDKYSYILVAPIHRADFEPDVIVVYGNPAQIARLIQATVCRTGDPVISSSFGRSACAQEIVRTILSDQCQFVLAGGGERVVAQAQDHEAVFAVPMSKVETVIEGLEGTHRAGVRYPTPSVLISKADLPPVYGQLMDYLRQGS